MLRIRTSQVRGGMRVAMPVFHPSSPGTVLLRPGVELDRELITRMVELRVRHLWMLGPLRGTRPAPDRDRDAGCRGWVDHL